MLSMFARTSCGFLVMSNNTKIQKKKKKKCKSSMGDPHSTEYWTKVSVVSTNIVHMFLSLHRFVNFTKITIHVDRRLNFHRGV